jgi:hypothetical protein
MATRQETNIGTVGERVSGAWLASLCWPNKLDTRCAVFSLRRLNFHQLWTISI